MYHVLTFIHSSVHGQLGGFQVLATTNEAVMDIVEQVSRKVSKKTFRLVEETHRHKLNNENGAHIFVNYVLKRKTSLVQEQLSRVSIITLHAGFGFMVFGTNITFPPPWLCKRIVSTVVFLC